MPGTELYGREGETEAIRGVLDAVAGGERRLLVLRGEAGIGKTRLLRALAEQASDRRLVVLEARATELERDVPLVPVIDALEVRLRSVPEPVLRELTSETLARLAQVFPGIAPGAVADGAATGERWRLHRAIAELLDVVAGGRPFALVLDDVHWADPATLELVEHLIRRPSRRPHLVALALRPGNAAERVLAAHRAAGAAGAAILDVRPLEQQAADALMAAIGDPRERERVFRESGGNPLLLQELARAQPGVDVPGGVVAAVAAELRDLPPDAMALLDAAAIDGDPFDLDVAAAVADLTPDAALTALDALAAADVIRPTADPRRFTFRHPVIRTAVYAGFPAGARLAAHAATAAQLAAAGAPLPVRARHLAHSATPGDTGAAATLRAAAGIVRPQAPSVAADWLAAALRAAPGGGPEPLAELAETLVEAGRLPEALEVVDEAMGVAGDGDPRARLELAGAAVERVLGRQAASRRRLDRALAAAPEGSPLAARVMAQLAFSAYEHSELAEMAEWARRAREAPVVDGPVLAAAAAMLAVSRAFAGDVAGAGADLDVAIAAVDAADDADLGRAGGLLTAVPLVLLTLERFTDGLLVARRSAAAVRQAGNGAVAVALDLAAVLALGLLGRITEAVEPASRAEQAARVTGDDQTVQWALWMRAWVLLEAGDLDPALVAARESVALARDLDTPWQLTVAEAVLGAVLAASGDAESGRELLARYDIDPGWVCRWAPVLVEADIAAGDLAAARRHGEIAQGLAPDLGMAGARAAAARAAALAALAGGDPDAAAALALAAAADAEQVDAALEAARDRLVAGRALAASDRTAAVRELTEAARAADVAGARRVHDEAVRELRRLGRRVGTGGSRGRGDHGLESLSGRELEIARLVATGLTNREIGERLYLSQKTIETHLSRVFAKLGVRSRAEVAAQIAAADQA